MSSSLSKQQNSKPLGLGLMTMVPLMKTYLSNVKIQPYLQVSKMVKLGGYMLQNRNRQRTIIGGSLNLQNLEVLILFLIVYFVPFDSRISPNFSCNCIVSSPFLAESFLSRIWFFLLMMNSPQV